MTSKLPHSCICIYKNCGIRSRDNILNVRFYRLPVTDKDRLKTWLVNSGCSDLTEESDTNLLKLRICSRHFPIRALYPSGRLKKDAEPVMYEIDSNDEDTDSSTANKKKDSEEIQMLQIQVERQNIAIQKLRNENVMLKRTLKMKSSKISRLQTKLQALIEGNLSDKTLFNALQRRVQGFLFTFITMQLFHKPQCSYTEDVKQFAKEMHCTSPSLYAKMREEFNFKLPGRSIISKWFSTVH